MPDTQSIEVERGLEVIGSKIYVNEIETRNPEIIGLAFIDKVEADFLNSKPKHDIKSITKAFELNGFRKTFVRENLIPIIVKLNSFTALDLIQYLFINEILIVPASVYNFINDCIDMDLLTVEVEMKSNRKIYRLK